MKKYSRIITLLLALVLTAATLPVYAEGADEVVTVLLPEEPGEAILMDGDPYYLPADLEDAIIVGINAGQEAINLTSFGISMAEAPAIIGEINSIFPYMHPELWNAHIVSYDGVGGVVRYLYVNYAEASKKAEYEAVVADILGEIDPDLSDFGKILWIHDYLCLNCEYDYENFCNDTVPSDSYTPYGALVNRIAVCQGYTLAYMDILARLGIESIAVESSDMNHVWLAILMEDEWYHMDATWDDPVTATSNGTPGKAYHDWFLRSDGYWYNYYDYDSYDPDDESTWMPEEIYYQWVHFNYAPVFETADQALIPFADTSYGSADDTAFWDDVSTQMYPTIDGESVEYYYYMDSEAVPAGLYKRSITGTVTLELDLDSLVWPVVDQPGYMWGLCSGFMVHDDIFYYNTPTQIVSYDYLAGTTTVFAEPELEADRYIYGLELVWGDDPEMRYNVSPSPNDAGEWRTTPIAAETEKVGDEIIITAPAGYFTNYGIAVSYKEDGRFIGLKMLTRSDLSCTFTNASQIDRILLFRLADDTDWAAAKAAEAIYTAGE